MMTTQGERLVRVETEVKALKESFESHKDHTDRQFEELKEKLDDLLALRNKGVGVFWLASGLLGTGIVGVLFQLISWLRGN
jgi:hypothetical protein